MLSHRNKRPMARSSFTSPTMHLCTLGLAVIVQLLSSAAVSTATTAFGCNDNLITDEWREMVLNFHNDKRRKVAEGKQTSKNNAIMPPGSDIHELNWDCNIENNAFLRNCNKSVEIPQDFSEISETINLNGENCNINTVTTTLLQKLWDEVKNEDLTDPKYNDATIKNFGIMANGPTTGFACTYNKCSGKLLCLYNKAPQKTQALYKSGNTCVNDPCAQGSSCENYLCKLAQYTPATNTYPIPLCSPQKNDGMTYEMQMSVLNLANYYRRLLGSGWAQDKNGYAPIARRLYALTYNCDLLGHFAKQIADKCGDPPYTPYARNWVLTHHKINDVNIDQKAALEEAFKAWGEQSKKVDLQEIAGGVFYDGDVVTEASDWAKLTTERNAVIGCAVTKCQQKGFTLVICHYNTIFTVRDSLYTVGKPCAGCAKVNRKCDNALGGGLCIP